MDKERRREQARLAQQRYRERHPQKVLAQQRGWRAANPEKVKERNARYRVEHPDRAKAAHDRWYAANRERRMATRKAWEERNKVHVLEQRRRRYAARKLEHRQRHNAARLARKQALIAMLGGKCTDCGCVPHIAAFEFDHVGTKTKNLSALLATPNLWDRAVEEAKQCELVCANCHRVRTADRTGKV
jgi:hypothetical protein